MEGGRRIYTCHDFLEQNTIWYILINPLRNPASSVRVRRGRGRGIEVVNEKQFHLWREGEIRLETLLEIFEIPPTCTVTRFKVRLLFLFRMQWQHNWGWIKSTPLQIRGYNRKTHSLSRTVGELNHQWDVKNTRMLLCVCGDNLKPG